MNRSLIVSFSGLVMMTSLHAAEPSIPLSPVSQLLGRPFSEALMPRGKPVDAQRVLDAMCFLEPVPIPRILAATHDGPRELPFFYMRFDPPLVSSPRGLILRPIEPKETLPFGQFLVGHLINPPPTGILRVRVKAVVLNNQSTQASGLELQLSKTSMRYPISFQDTTPQWIDFNLFIDDLERKPHRQHKDHPEQSVVEFTLCNRLAQPWPEANKAKISEWLCARDGSTPLPWLAIPALEMELTQRIDVLSPAEKLELAATQDGERVIQLMAERFLGRRPTAADVDGLLKTYRERRTAKDGVDTAIRAALKPLVSTVLANAKR